MKILKIIGIVIAALLALILILGLVAPKNYHVERSLVINAPKAMVFEHVKFWRNWQAWSPWAEMDTTMQMTYQGLDGTIGSGYEWQGKKAGSGAMTTTGLMENDQLAYHLAFKTPVKSESDGYVKLADASDGTNVTWALYGKNNFPWNAFALFMSMDRMVGKDFEHGLELLRAKIDAQVAEAQKYTIQEVNFPGRVYAAMQQEVAMDKLQDFFAQSYGAVMQELGKRRIRFSGAPAALYNTWDDVRKFTTVAAGIPVASDRNLGGLTVIKLPAGKAFTVDYYGPYEKVASAYYAFDLYFWKNKLQPKMPVIEEYVTDPGAEPDSSKWLTRIYFFAE